MRSDRSGLDCVPVREVTASRAEADRLTGLDDETRREIQTFLDVLGAQVVEVIPRGASDKAMADGLTWEEWHRRQLSQIFASGRMTAEEVAAQAARSKRERLSFIEKWRRVSHGWAKWCKWRAWAPADAEEYRREYEDGQLEWLLELAAAHAAGQSDQKNEVAVNGLGAMAAACEAS